MAFKPSPYQQKIYDFLTDEKGNAVVSAVAGSGKTTTILNAMDLIPHDKTVLFLAFNRSIAQELKERVPQRSTVHVKTVHGFGMSALNRDLSFEVFNGKYSKMLREIMGFLETSETDMEEAQKLIEPYGFKTDEMKMVYDMYVDWKEEQIENPKGYLSRVVQLCDLGRLNLINIEDEVIGIKQLEKIAKKHDVELVNGECYRAWMLIKLGIYYTEKIDFTDMVFLPIIFKLRTYKYDYVFIDECQDLNACQRTLMLKAVKYETGRFIAVGDPHQAIYGFSGADSDSFKKLTNIPNTIQLPLSVCYRCGKKIIEKAQSIIPHIQAFEGSGDGVVDYDADLTTIRDEDMILCRNTYPIVRLCLKLLSEGRKARIMGGDIGRSLIKMIEDTKRKREAWTLENVFNRLYADLEKVLKNLMKKEGLTEEEAKETNAYSVAKERIEVVEMLAKGCGDPQDVIDKIAKIFDDNQKGGIVLSTIHKSKGLEADRVLIIHPEKMPSKYATQDWEKEQEENLRYVAYTRAKSYLGFIDATKFDAWADADDESQQGNVQEVKESQFIGAVGDKLPVTLTVTLVKEMDTSFGATNLYEFIDDDGNLFSKWGTIPDRFIVSNHKEIDEGTIVQFNATVKQHKEFKGEKMTVLSHLARYKK
jgi:superfamily I DNA/RNA helicase